MKPTFPALSALIFSTATGLSAETKPNVLLIVSDDQGYGDLSRTGNRMLETPNIDRLAADGATMNQFFVQPLCAPTRAEILTGRYFPFTGVSGVCEGAERVNLDETFISELFKDAGYATGCFGKWHSGMQYPYHPCTRGFDEFIASNLGVPAAPVRVDTLGGTPESPEFISVVNNSDEEREITLAGAGDYVGVFTGRKLLLQANTAIAVEGKDAELFAQKGKN